MELSQRQKSLFNCIYRQKTLSVKKLTKLCPYSRETLRKELLALESLGLIERCYGKITFLANEASGKLIEEKQKPNAAQRRELILAVLKEHRNVRLTTLVSRLRVSAITVRSDLNKLVMEGLVVKKHGSVSLLPGTFAIAGPSEAENFSPHIKVMGRHILLRISPGETIYIRGKELARFVALSLPLYAGISVITDSAEIISLLLKRDYPSPVYILPGKLQNDSGIIVVNHAEAFLSEIKIDKAFFLFSSHIDGMYFMETPEAVLNAVTVSNFTPKLYFILDSIKLDKRDSCSFPYREYREKVQEILIDDSVDSSMINSFFLQRDPVVMYGSDYSLKLGRRLKYRIGLLVDQKRGYFSQAVYNSVLESSVAHENLSLVIRECSGGFSSTVKIAELLLNDRPDLVINFSLCMESLCVIEEKCGAHGVKLINIDLQSAGSVYFGANNALAGTMAGAHTVDFIRNFWRGQLDRIIIFTRHGMDYITNRRIISMVEKIRMDIHMTFPEPVSIEWDNPETKPKEELVRLLMEIPKNDKVLFISYSLSFSLASYNIIVQYREADNTIIVGQNFNNQIQELMKKPDSPILGCVDYNPEEYGNRVLNLAIRMLKGEKVDVVNYTTHTWISKEKILAGNIASESS